MSKGLAKLLLVKSKITSISGKSYPYYFILAASLAAFYNIWFLILVIFLIYKYRSMIKYKLLLVFTLLLIFSFSISYLKRLIKAPQELKGVVVEVYDNKNELIIRKGLKKYLIKTKDNYEVGDIIIVEGECYQPAKMRTPYGFNAKKYYLSKNIDTIYDSTSTKKVGNNYLYFLNKLIYKYLEMYPSETKVYLKALILGINEYESDFKAATRSLQISYLLSLSGILVYAFIKLLRKLCYYLDLKSSTQTIIILIFLLSWNLLGGFKFVLIRLLIMTLFQSLSKHLNLKLTRLDIIFYTFISILFINFNYIYSLGFALSFIVLTAVELSHDLIKTNNKLINRYLHFIVIYLFIFPQLISINNEVYIMVFILTPLLVLSFQKGIIYLFIAVIIMPFLSPLLDYYLFYLSKGLTYLSKVPIKLFIPSFSRVIIFLYYVILVWIFSNRFGIITKRIIPFIILFVTLYNKAYFNPGYKIYFLDVGQGDTTIFITPYNRKVIVIDAYGDVSGVLTRLGIRRVDYLILTHPDQDHIGKANEVIKNQEVGMVLVNPYDNYYLNHFNIKTVEANDFIMDSDFKISFLGPLKNYYENNDNSLVFKLEYLDEVILFCGDISIKVELDLVATYRDELQATTLKLAHHGSKTSTSSEFLRAVNPKNIVISLGFKNRYGFPHQEVMSRIENNYQIHRTDLDATIYYYALNKRLKMIKHYQNYIKYYIIW